MFFRRSAPDPYMSEGAPPAPRRRSNPVTGLVMSTLCVALIAYGAALAISRTAGFRSFAQRKVAEVLGFDVRFGKTALTPGLDFVIEDASGGGTNAATAMRVGRARLAFSWRAVRGGGHIRALTLEDAALSFRQTADGQWTPAVFSDAAALIERGSGLNLNVFGDASEARRPAASPGGGEVDAEDRGSAGDIPGRRISLRKTDLHWWSTNDSRLAVLKGLDLDVTPADLPGRHVLHVRLSADSFERERGETIRGLAAELLLCDDRKLVLTMQCGQPPATPVPTPPPADEAPMFLERPASRVPSPPPPGAPDPVAP